MTAIVQSETHCWNTLVDYGRLYEHTFGFWSEPRCAKKAVRGPTAADVGQTGGLLRTGVVGTSPLDSMGDGSNKRKTVSKDPRAGSRRFAIGVEKSAHATHALLWCWGQSVFHIYVNQKTDILFVELTVDG